MNIKDLKILINKIEERLKNKTITDEIELLFEHKKLENYEYIKTIKVIKVDKKYYAILCDNDIEKYKK